MFRRLSIRGKLLGILAMTTCIALLVAGLSIIAYDFLAYKRQRINELSTQAEMLGAIATAALTFDDSKAAHEYLRTLSLRPTLRLGALYDSRGALFATYRKAGDPALPLPDRLEQGYRVEDGDLLLFRPIRKGPDVIGTVYLRADLGLGPRLRGYAGIVLAVMLCSLLLALLVSDRLQALISAPLLEVTKVARGVIERQDYSPRVLKRGEDEVGVLVDAFNQMVAQIQLREAALQATNRVLKRRTEELGRSNEDLERFAHIASHDLQEPLRMVASFTQLLARRYEGKLDPEADEYIHFATTGAQTMQALIRGLLAYSQVGSGGHEGVPTPLGEVVAHAHALMMVGFREAKATLEVGDLPTLTVDPIQFTQLFQNLLGNALKFRSERPLRIEVGARPEGDGWTLWVKDNGIGLDPRYKDRIFVIFQRLHTRDEYPGAGIGLSVCKRILERHGGTIWVESQPQEGSTFYFHVPDPIPEGALAASGESRAVQPPAPGFQP